MRELAWSLAAATTARSPALRCKPSDAFFPAVYGIIVTDISQGSIPTAPARSWKRWACACAAISLLVAVPARAALFIVNSTTDAVDVQPGNGSCATSTGKCTLRAAIQEANALPGADTIIVPAGTYALTIAGSGENSAATGDLDIFG